jgi:hypothetical protein
MRLNIDLKLFIKNTKLSKIVEIVNKFIIKNPKKALIFGIGIQIGGVWYTWYELSKIFNIQNKEDRELANELENDFKEGKYKSHVDKFNSTPDFEDFLESMNRMDDDNEDYKIIEI